MKIFSILICIILILSASSIPAVIDSAGRFADNGTGNTSEKKQPAGAAIIIDSGILYINGKKIPAPWSLNDFITAAGRPDRTTEATNRILTYDSLGLILYQYPDTGGIHSMSLYFKAGSHPFLPQNIFSGELTVDGLSINGRTPSKKITGSLQHFGFVKSILPKTIQAMHPNMTGYYVEYADENYNEIVYFNMDTSKIKQETGDKAGSVKTGGMQDKKPAVKVSMKIDNGVLNINGKKIPAPWILEDFKKALGEPDRSLEGMNIILTWDTMGCILYQDPKSEAIHSMSLYFKAVEHHYAPANLFSGELTVDGFTITRDTSWEMIKENLPNISFRRSVLLKTITARDGNQSEYFIEFTGDDYREIVYFNMDTSEIR